MFKFLVVLSAVLAIAAAGSSGDVDEALLARVAQILSENEGSSGGSGGSAGGLDGELLSRVSQILSQNEGSSGSSSSGYDAPPPPSSGYGAPSRSASRSSSGIDIGRPERAERVAEFDLSSQGQDSRSSGGYN